MKESIEVIVSDRDNDEACLSVEKDDDVITFYLQNEAICSGDWTANFLKLFKRAVQKWEVID